MKLPNTVISKYVSYHFLQDNIKPGVRIKHSTKVIGDNLYLFGGIQVPFSSQ